MEGKSANQTAADDFMSKIGPNMGNPFAGAGPSGAAPPRADNMYAPPSEWQQRPHGGPPGPPGMQQHAHAAMGGGRPPPGVSGMGDVYGGGMAAPPSGYGGGRAPSSGPPPGYGAGSSSQHAAAGTSRDAGRPRPSAPPVDPQVEAERKKERREAEEARRKKEDAKHDAERKKKDEDARKREKFINSIPYADDYEAAMEKIRMKEFIAPCAPSPPLPTRPPLSPLAPSPPPPALAPTRAHPPTRPPPPLLAATSGTRACRTSRASPS